MIGQRDPMTWGGDPWQGERAEAINRAFEHADGIEKPIPCSRDTVPNFDSVAFWEQWTNEQRSNPGHVR